MKAEKSKLEKEFYDLSLKIVSEVGLELYDLEWHPSNGLLQVFIMNPETKTANLDDCVKVDRAFSPYTETLEWIPENLVLEVSSPGLFRNLTTLKHFSEVVGEEITVNLIKKIDESKYPDFPKSMRNNLKLKVKLLSADDKALLVEAKGIRVEIPYEQIKKANLETNINQQP